MFNGEVFDYEDGNLTGTSLNWTSSKDGYLGNGSAINKTGLSTGTHTITLTAEDSEDFVTTSSIDIIIVGLSNILINKFLDTNTEKNLTFTSSANQTAYVSIHKTANISYSSVNVRGFSP